MTPLPPPDTTVVTGASGWLGRSLLHRFTEDEGPHARPGRIVAVVPTAQDAALVQAISTRVDVAVADVADRAAVDAALARSSGVTDVLHTAGVIHPARVADFARVNAEGTRHVAEAALAGGVRRLVHVSSNSPFGTNPHHGDTFGEHEPYNPYLGYGESKMHGELAVLAAVERGLDAVIVRPPWFYGPFQPARQTAFFTMVRTGRFPVFGHGQQRRSMVYVDNLVQGVVRAEEATGVTGRGYWIADSRPYTVAEIVDTVRRALTEEGIECSGRALRVPVVIGRVAERADRVLQARGAYQQQVHVLGEMAHSIAVDISAAQRDLDYRPEVELHEGMRRSIRWCREQGIEL